jgi:D-sedoheptulose 7-phosphate isomerase
VVCDAVHLEAALPAALSASGSAIRPWRALPPGRTMRKVAKQGGVLHNDPSPVCAPGSARGDIMTTGNMTKYHEYLAQLSAVLGNLPLEDAVRGVDMLYRAYCNHRTIFLFGNGGSAALASHLAADLGKGVTVPGPDWKTNPRRLRVMSLTDNTPVLTAWANDASYERVFAAQMENFIQPGDVAFAISGSGNSANVLRGLELARQVGASTLGLAGFGGGKMKALLDCPIVVQSHQMQRVEDAHVVLAHLMFLDLMERLESSTAAK